MFFQATNFAAGRELWKSDGSSIGTVVVKDIYPGNTGSVLNQSLANVNGILYFTANDGTNGSELWKSDGTDAGTVMVYDINPGNADAEPVYYTLSGNNLFFSANEIINGAELWVLNTSGVAVPAPPSNLIVTPLRLQNATVASIIQLDWTDNSSNETGFHIERSLNGTSGWTLAGSVLTDITNFADTGLTASTAYYYQVNAYNAGGGSTYSNIANATTTGIEGALNKPVLCFVYPNPVNSTATLNISGIVKSFENTQFIIYNTFGIKVRELTVTSYQVTFEKVELASGLYHFQLINDAEIISTGKLIFQ